MATILATLKSRMKAARAETFIRLGLFILRKPAAVAPKRVLI